MPATQIQIAHEIVDLTLRQYIHSDTKRFKLVEIAFKQALRDQATPGRPCDGPNEIGAACVAFADAQIAAMENADKVKDGEAVKGQQEIRRAMAGTAPDTGPSAGEVQEEIIEIDEDGVVHGIGKKPALAIALAIRAKLQARLDADAHANADNPTTNLRVGGYRDGGSDAYRHVLAMIDAVMKKTGAENA